MNLIGLAGIADQTGLQRSTVHMYHSRGLLPDPDVEVDGRPLWNRDTIAAWEATRATNMKNRKGTA